MRFDEEVYFHWELMGADFREAQASGFTAAVTVNTGYFGSADVARADRLGSALGLLATYLYSVPPQHGRPLY